MNMASSGYYSYYQPMPYYYNYSQQQPAEVEAAARARPVHLFFFLATVFLLAAGSLYAQCESAVESLLDQLRLFLILSPLLLIVAVQLWLAASGGDRQGGGGLIYFLAQLVGGQQTGTYGRYGGGASSPWGVALVLVLFLVSYQSSLQNWWFPLRRR